MPCLFFLVHLVTLFTSAFPPAEKNVKPDSFKSFEVIERRNIDYYQGGDRDPVKHKLDIYAPKGTNNAPVFVFVHGGAWVQGDKDFWGIYSAIGKFMASRGIVSAVISYRLSPRVKHPAHAEDVARAISWTHANISKHGGDPNKIFLCGHSAGGHLVSLVTCDESYLKKENIDPRCILAVISISGVYEIPKYILGSVFGTESKVKEQASPIHHVRKGLPPFLILCADRELPMCDSKECQRFQKALKDQGNRVSFEEITSSNHMKIIFDASKPDKSVSEKILNFMGQILTEASR